MSAMTFTRSTPSEDRTVFGSTLILGKILFGKIELHYPVKLLAIDLLNQPIQE